MDRLGPGETTLPSRTRSRRDAARSELSLLWVHPEDGVTSLAAERVLLGRGEDCDKVLGGRETSRHHAEVTKLGPVSVLRDLRSRNGIFVNGARTTEAPLSDGDVIRLGEWVAVVASLVSVDVAGEIAPGLIGGALFRDSIRLAETAAKSDVPIVIEGETGTGKECVARAIHAWSGRRGAFVAVNCAALPESLAEAELFGHRKGAFSGADRDTLGYFRAAHQGTLLLDEIVDLPLTVAAKLLRVLEQAEVVPLGDTRAVAVDVRVIAAAQRPIAQAVKEKRFRADLHARLGGVSVALPPLRERREDIPALFRHFLERQSGGPAPALRPRVVEQLCMRDWPLNVREVAQLARRLLAVRGTGGEVSEKELALLLPPEDPVEPVASSKPSEGRRQQRDAALLQRLEQELKKNGGNVKKASATLGISRQRAYRLLQASGSDLDSIRFPLPDEQDERTG